MGTPLYNPVRSTVKQRNKIALGTKKLDWEEFKRTHPRPDGIPADGITRGKEIVALVGLAHRYAQAPNARFLEMWTHFGHTAVALAKTCPWAHVYTFDTAEELGVWPLPGNTEDEVLPMRDVGSAILGAAPEVRDRITFAARPPAQLHVAARSSGPHDLVFIDGNHSWRGVVEDTKCASDCAKKGTLLVWDDYWDSCPEAACFIDILSRRIEGAITHVEKTRLCYLVLDKTWKIRTLKEALVGL